MAAYIDIARKAFALAKKGKSNIEIKVELGLPYSKDAAHAVEVGRIDASFEEPRLTPDEMTLIMRVAEAERRDVERGIVCSPKLKYCSGLFWARGKAERVARKRLGSHRYGEDERRPGTGLALLRPYHGGYVRLTRAGWAMVHALEVQAKNAVASAEKEG